jgi:SNF2 family DNA or RNA helicase
MLAFEDYSWPMKNPEHRPFKHQKETAVFLINNKRAYNFSDLGTGKTMSALWACDLLFCNQKIRKVLIVAPLSTLQAVWGREIFDNLPHRKYRIAHGTRDQRIHAINSDADFVIINHDGVTIVEEEIIKQKFDIVIIDELTAFKKHTNNRTKSMIRIAKSCKAVWGMTGEPTPNSPIEAFGQAKVVNPDNKFLPKYFTAFRQMVEVQVGPYTWIPTRNAAEIVHHILQPSIRFERDKCIDIPPCQYQNIEVEFTDEQKIAYKKMKEELILEYQNGLITASNAAVKFSKLLQIAAGSVKDDVGNVIKFDSSSRDMELWKIFEDTKKTKLVVFCAFRASIFHLEEFFTKKGAKVGCIYGGVDHNKRSQLINEFQTGDLQILIIQPQSSAHGITLTAANVVVWYSLIASGEIYNQANGRITRAGQTRKQLIIHLIGCKAEQRLLDILADKSKMSKNILNMFIDL